MYTLDHLLSNTHSSQPLCFHELDHIISHVREMVPVFVFLLLVQACILNPYTCTYIWSRLKGHISPAHSLRLLHSFFSPSCPSSLPQLLSLFPDFSLLFWAGKCIHFPSKAWWHLQWEWICFFQGCAYNGIFWQPTGIGMFCLDTTKYSPCEIKADFSRVTAG